MTTTSITASALALLFSAGLAAQGAVQPQNPPTQQTPPAPATTGAKVTTVLTGCLYTEDKIPGRTPNAAERAGVLEDYILADASIVGPLAEAAGSKGATPAAGTMFEIEGPASETLAALAGKRVEVTGRIDNDGAVNEETGRPTADRGLGPDAINLPEFDASAIREVSGTCPATPDLRR